MVDPLRDTFLAKLLLTAFVLLAAFPTAAQQPPIPIPIPETSSPYLDAVTAHLDYLTEHSLDEAGPESTMLWPASIDIKTNQPMNLASANSHSAVSLPAGVANLSWEQPTFVAALELSRRTGCKCYHDSVTHFTEDWIELAEQQETRDESALQFTALYHLANDKFGPSPQKALPPFTPAWEMMWMVSPEATKQVIAKLDKKSANPSNAKPSLIGSLVWLANQSDPINQSQIARALDLARSIPLHDNSIPVGELATNLLQTSEISSQAEFRELAESIITNRLNQKIDAFSPRRSTPHPLPLAEATLTLHALTPRPQFRQALLEWQNQIDRRFCEIHEQGASAEDYGRAIHFLLRVATELNHPRSRDLAVEIADNAMEHLYANKLGMFRSHPGEDRCDSVEGAGILLLALLFLDGDVDATKDSAFHF